MDELIYRYALLEQIEKDSEGTLGSYGENWQFINTIRKMPTIKRRPRGHWILQENQRQEDVDNGNYLFVCSECGKADIHSKATTVSFCWNCGADMRGGDAE